MALIVRDLPPIKTLTTPAGAGSLTNGVGSLDDANSISLYFTSSAIAATTNVTIQVSQFDPAIAVQTGVSQSTAWYNLSTAIATFTSSGSQLLIPNVSFRGLRFSFTATSSQSVGEIMAYVTKQISV